MGKYFGDKVGSPYALLVDGIEVAVKQKMKFNLNNIFTNRTCTGVDG